MTKTRAQFWCHHSYHPPDMQLSFSIRPPSEKHHYSSSWPLTYQSGSYPHKYRPSSWGNRLSSYQSAQSSERYLSSTTQPSLTSPLWELLDFSSSSLQVYLQRMNFSSLIIFTSLTSISNIINLSYPNGLIAKHHQQKYKINTTHNIPFLLQGWVISSFEEIINIFW